MLFKKERHLKALQVEVTSRCTRKCSLCPQTALSDKWLNGDLSMGCWERLVPDLDLATHVHLQGWGEPLMHPHLPEMVLQAKRAGCQVGITTNGDLLERHREWILKHRVDLITLSLAGNETSHPAFRGGTPFQKVLASASSLSAESKLHKIKTKVQVGYLLTRDNAKDLPEVVEAVAESGIDEFFITHLDTTPTETLLEQSAFGESKLAKDLVDHLSTARAVAHKYKIRFRGPSVQAEDVLTCALNPLRYAFITHDGRVGPCVNLLLPIDSETIPRWTFNGLLNVPKVEYGRLPEMSLSEILFGNERKEFCKSFENRLSIEKNFLTKTFSKSRAEAFRLLKSEDKKRNEQLNQTPFPDQCNGCHKMRNW